MVQLYLLLNLVAMVTVSTSVHNTHHVNTIALFPERTAWCEAQEIEQIIGHDQCTSKPISNRVCVGQCFSYRIPRTVPPTPNKEDLHYCDCCRPSVVTWEKITLDCNSDEMPQVDKMVEMIQECTCKACHAEPRNSKPIEI
ncbi:neuroblastoma, suppression of tumorigenicity 1 precursor [Saccoglossus kowalevskii]|uniref:DAN protein n=1 Tax=Saccoglossus kowalevskii TaxID=10224 RepID=B5B3S9_SACKO|nr:neuroblastoma, suppression of tumorigenicity 1 precursor [Saccoglossus kowalevskii]ACG70191.1 DAN protein [Saccoglossus kowalevskii]